MSYMQRYQMEQEEARKRAYAEAAAAAAAEYAAAKAAQDAYEAAEAERRAALTPEQREAEEAAQIARWNANRQIEIDTFNARRRPVAPPAYPIKPVDLEGEPE